jgi:hypothetical protein
MLRRKAAGKPMPDGEMLKVFVEAYESILRKPRASIEDAATETVAPSNG